MKQRPKIAITTGDPSGIGAEVILKALFSLPWQNQFSPIIYGDLRPYQSIVRSLGGTMDKDCLAYQGQAFFFKELNGDWDLIEEEKAGWIYFNNPAQLESQPIYGRAMPGNGICQYRWFEQAVLDFQQGRVKAIVTGPVNKSNIASDGIPFRGHTEVLEQLTRTPAIMLFYTPRLCMALVTRHIPLRSVPDEITTDKIIWVTQTVDWVLKKVFEIASPRIAIAGLNPHASDNGLFGSEEERVIQPAVQKLRRSGISIDGPFPPDSIFTIAPLQGYQAIVCLYHDQGLIPIKLGLWGEAVNLTIGTQILRTSVDHGVAYDIAGKGQARHESMAAAIRLAVSLAERRVQLQLAHDDK